VRALLFLLCAAAPAPAPLLDVSTQVPDLRVDLRYATADNFLKQAVYPAGAKCLALPETAERLRKASLALRTRGFRLQAWDCYRPFAVQKQMWALFPHKGYVADPNHGGSHHNRGAAVDVTLVTREGAPVEMPTPFDTFSHAAYLRFDGGSKASREHRDVLVRAMEEAGFKPNPMEWWHFELQDAIEHPILDAPLSVP
jgi:D-alanyl-D-alanine dipeptidase